MQDLFAVYGASGYGREVMPLARAQIEAKGLDAASLVFLDDAPNSGRVNGHRVMSYDEFLSTPAPSRYVSIAIANSDVRERLMRRCMEDGVRSWSIAAKNIVCMDNVEVGDGAILNPFVTLTSNIRIGIQFHANIYSYVAHDCVIGNYVTFAPGVKCNGNVVIEDHAYIGTGAILRQGTPTRPLIIGRNAVVGMGAVVTRDVPPGWTVIGNPARQLVKD